jgi:hypothetical protein
MAKQKQEKSFTRMCKPVNNWDKAIFDAEQQIVNAKAKIAKLRQSVRAFKTMRDNGEPFPGETAQEPEAQP